MLGRLFRLVEGVDEVLGEVEGVLGIVVGPSGDADAEVGEAGIEEVFAVRG